MSLDDPHALCSLLYVSTAVPGIAPADLQSILQSSRQHNGDNNITGLLLFCRGHFIQVLEGPADAVDDTYQRICNDPRHTHLKLMMQEPCETRFFHEWDMAFKELHDTAPVQHPSLEALLAANAQGSLKAVQRLFTIFQASLA